MKSVCYFDECKECFWREYKDDLIMCSANRLRLALYNGLLEIIPELEGKCYCRGFEKEI